MEAKVSIIVPIHNDELHLKRCVDSLLAQTLREIEIILVDDDSTDGSVGIVDEYALQDERVVTLHRPLGSFGSAVNAGVDAAKGEYVTIVAPCDWVEPEMCEDLYGKGHSNRADVVKCHYRQIEKGSSDGIIEHHIFLCTLFDSTILQDEIRQHCKEAFTTWWGTYYRLTFLRKHQIRFTEGLNPQTEKDYGYSWRLMEKAERCYISRNSYYCHQKSDYGYPVSKGYDAAVKYLEGMRQHWLWCRETPKMRKSFQEQCLKALYDEVLSRMKKQCRGLEKIQFIVQAAQLMRECAHEASFAQFNHRERKDYKLVAHHPIWRMFKMALYYRHDSPECSYTRLFGVRLTCTRRNEYLHKKYLLGIPCKKEIYHDGKRKKYFFGIRYKTNYIPAAASSLCGINREEEDTRMLGYAVYANAVFALHQKTFSRYRCCNKGFSSVLIATGPTINDSPHICDGVKCLGVNRAIMMEQFKLNYFFASDYLAVKSYIDIAFDYGCINFFGLYTQQRWEYLTIPNWVAEKAHAERFYREGRRANVYQDISCFPLADYGSITHAALNFLLYTHPRRIYLIGCDTSNNGYYEKNITQLPMHLETLREGYVKLKEMRDIYYPDVEIISVNPIGLRGLFRDVYTQSYLAKHPEIEVEEGAVIESIGQTI